MVLLLLCMVMLSRVRSRLVVCVDGFALNTRDSVTVGRGSNVAFDLVPSDYLVVKPDSSGWSWKVSEACLKSDSICYFKINDKNPNLHLLEAGQVVVVKIGNEKHTLDVSQLDGLLDGHDSQYVMLRNVLEKQRQETGKGSGDFRKMASLRSFFYRERGKFGGLKGPWQLVILDLHTTIEGQGSAIGFCASGHVDQCLKVQFYRMAEYSFLSKDSDIFRVGEVNYMAKPMLITTRWGAGHAMLRANGEGIEVTYPKPLTYTEDCDTLKQLTGRNTSLVTLLQADGSLPVGHSLFVPQFSSAMPQEVCHVRLMGDSIVVADKKVKSRWMLMPHLQRTTVDQGVGRIHLQVGKLGTKMMLSYLWLPLAVFLLTFFTYPLFMRVDGISIRNKTPWATRLPNLFQMVALIAFVYGVCRVMVAFKLSWTYPYFEKLTGVVVVSVALIQMLLYNLSVVFNQDILLAKPTLRGRRVRKKTLRPWAAFGVAVAGVALCAAGMYYMDHHFSRDILKSYMEGDTFSPFPWKWASLKGTNDLHRSVPYTLMLFNVLAILVMLLRNVFPNIFSGIHRILFGSQKAALSSDDNHRFAFLRRANGRAVAVALCYAFFVALASVIPGNFSSALITLLLVVGMGHAMSLMDYTESRLWGLATSLAITLIMLLAAIAMPGADKGYFTNYLGFACMAVVLYALASKYKRKSPSSSELSENIVEHRWMNWVLVGVLACVLFLVPKAMSLFYDAEEVDYSRTSRRFQMYSQFDKYRNSGYRYAVSDAEFMTVMIHGMYNASGADPLSPEHHPLHPSVSTGQSPVVLNDVSLPIAFFGTYGILSYVVFFSLLALLLLAVLGYGIPGADGEGRMSLSTLDVDVTMLWRLLAVMMWVCTSYYLYASYVGQFPFTGRLCPGYGVDSVGEALESAILLAFMTTSLLKYDSKTAEEVSRL